MEYEQSMNKMLGYLRTKRDKNNKFVTSSPKLHIQGCTILHNRDNPDQEAKR